MIGDLIKSNHRENQIMDDQDQEANQPAPLALESLDDYIRRRGIALNVDTERNGEFNGMTRDEATRQISDEKNYLDSVIRRHFDEHEEEDDKNLHASLSDYQQSDTEDEAVILIQLSDNATHTAKVKPLVQFCETVRRAVISRSRFGVARIDGDSQKSGESSQQTKSKEYIMELSLIDFDSTAVVQFIDVVVSLFYYNATLEDSGTDSDTKSPDRASSRKRRINADKRHNSHIQHLLYLMKNNKISEHNVAECLRISHYLQCSILLDFLASVLEASIDSQNCMSICWLADLYNLKSLFEASINHVVGRLDALQGKSNKDDDVDEGCISEDERIQHEIWHSLPHELRSRILTMRNVMRSSVIGRGSKVSGVFFSNGDEFLAIFKETLCDLRERLAEARERRLEVIREREAEWESRKQRRGGRWSDFSDSAKSAFVYSGDVEYALSKIQKQEQRIRTLESFYEEQRIIFSSSNFGDSKVIL